MTLKPVSPQWISFKEPEHNDAAAVSDGIGPRESRQLLSPGSRTEYYILLGRCISEKFSRVSLLQMFANSFKVRGRICTFTDNAYSFFSLAAD